MIKTPKYYIYKHNTRKLERNQNYIYRSHQGKQIPNRIQRNYFYFFHFRKIF